MALLGSILADLPNYRKPTTNPPEVGTAFENFPNCVEIVATLCAWAHCARPAGLGSDSIQSNASGRQRQINNLDAITHRFPTLQTVYVDYSAERTFERKVCAAVRQAVEFLGVFESAANRLSSLNLPRSNPGSQSLVTGMNRREFFLKLDIAKPI